MDYNIYSIDTWAPSTSYYQNKILTYNNLYYYAAFSYTSSSSITTDINNGNLNGYIYNMGQNKPYFTWKGNFGFSNENTPRVKKIQFGDGYFQIIPDGINNLLLNYKFTFQGDLAATTAILHFLYIRNGTESFCLLPPAPRGLIGRFICPTWTDTEIFYNNFKVECNFIQTPV